MPLGDHLEELRRRVIWSLVVPVPVFALCLAFGPQLLTFLTGPVRRALQAAGQPTRMLATHPLETVVAWMKVSAIVTVLVTLPWVIYQVWLFVAPGLMRAERRFVHLLLPMSAVMTVLSAVFLYTVLLPVSLVFLIGLGSSLVKQTPQQIELPPGLVLPDVPMLEGDPFGVPHGQMWFNDELNELRLQTERGVIGFPGRGGGVIAQEYRIGEYVSLVFTLGFVFAIAFQLPVAMLLLGWVGILEPHDLTGYRRYVAMGCAVAGAVFTPQDPLSMIMLGAALYALFELGIVLMRVLPAERVAGSGGDQSGDDV